MRLYPALSLSTIIEWLAYLSILQRVLLDGVCVDVHRLYQGVHKQERLGLWRYSFKRFTVYLMLFPPLNLYVTIDALLGFDLL